jgi:hypothetical protein
MLHSREFLQGSGWLSVMTVQEKCDERRRGVRPRSTLRKVREGWGTPSVGYAGEIRCFGRPPKFSVSLSYCPSSVKWISFISLISVITMACVPFRSNTVPLARTYLPTNGISFCR